MAKKIIDLAAPTLPLTGTELMEMSEGGTLSVKVAVNEAMTTLYYDTTAVVFATFNGASVAEYLDSETGVLRTSGDLAIEGNLFVDGTTWVVNNQEVSTSDNIIVINAGEVGPGVTAGAAGIMVDRGTEPEYQFLFVEASDTFRVGEIGNLQAVATREDSPIDGGFAIWNDTLKRFDTTTNTSSSVVHNEATGLQGGDSTADEFYHLTQAIHDGLYSGSPIIGLGNVSGTNLEVDYGSHKIEASVNGTLLLEMSETIQTLGSLTDTGISINQSTNTITLEGNNTTAAEFGNFGIRAYYVGNQVFRTQSNGVLVLDASNVGTALNYSGSFFNIQNAEAGSGISLRAKQAGSLDVDLIKMDPDGSVEIYHSGDKVFETDTTGVVILGDLQVELGSTINEFYRIIQIPQFQQKKLLKPMLIMLWVLV